MVSLAQVGHLVSSKRSRHAYIISYKLVEVYKYHCIYMYMYMYMYQPYLKCTQQKQAGIDTG